MSITNPESVHITKFGHLVGYVHVTYFRVTHRFSYYPQLITYIEEILVNMRIKFLFHCRTMFTTSLMEAFLLLEIHFVFHTNLQLVTALYPVKHIVFASFLI